mmetsp:Transcript_36377/g.108702  ORF Transcript_36377/g.108702 Transcript_36377/m.108702 type:complete len:222 (-) Transcript_36377:1329-1994(-)
MQPDLLDGVKRLRKRPHAGLRILPQRLDGPLPLLQLPLLLPDHPLLLIQLPVVLLLLLPDHPRLLLQLLEVLLLLLAHHLHGAVDALVRLSPLADHLLCDLLHQLLELAGRQAAAVAQPPAELGRGLLGVGLPGGGKRQEVLSGNRHPAAAARAPKALEERLERPPCMPDLQVDAEFRANGHGVLEEPWRDAHTRDHVEVVVPTLRHGPLQAPESAGLRDP